MSLPDTRLLAAQQIPHAAPIAARRHNSQAWSSTRRTVARYALDYLFLVPMLVLFVAFTIWPIVATWIYSLYSWDGYEPLQKFVGLANFAEAARDPGYWTAFAHTFTFSIAAIVIPSITAHGA